MRPRSRKRKRTAGKRNADFSPFQRTAGPSKKRSEGTRSQPKGVPAQAQRSGLRGERTSNGVSEPCRLRRGEGYGVCEADGAVQGGLGALPPTSRLDLPPTAGGPISHRGSHDALLAGTLKGSKLIRLTRVCGGVAPRGELY